MRYRLLMSLFIEILSPAKVLSLAFQKEGVDIVSMVSTIEKTKKQREKLGKTDFKEYPTYHRIMQV